MSPGWVVLAKMVSAFIAGFVVFVILVPTSGAEPPLCYSLLAFQVPCDGQVPIVVGALTGSFVGLALWLGDRRRTQRQRLAARVLAASRQPRSGEP
jgi:hypothetical protein